ncbi:alpha/beta fold hydrolase [uncultured Amnibacterium sp.]|uniref:alpha/beta fold hydrolase n=1 Tax=uncultured Amnibacterium sp. TaxID=1631851 RepID=UPI0035CA796B
MTDPSTAPTVVLVHGAFADSSGWNDVITELLGAGVQVRAVPNPLRGIEIDSAYVAGVFASIPGPVLAVGHSYGGAVITNASERSDNVIGLVYVAAFAPDEGETLQDIEAGSTDSVLNSVLVPSPYPAGDGSSQTELWISAEGFHDAFAADLPIAQTDVMARTQRPVSALAFSEPNGVPGWRTRPSWAVVATGDHAAGADAVHRMAERANATIVEAEGSHVIMISQPHVVAQTIQEALHSVMAPA